MKKFILLAFFALTFNVSNSQNRITDVNNNLWFLVHGDYKISDKVGLDSEVHLRVANMGDSKQQTLLRPSVYYQAHEQVRFYFGYTYINTYPYGDRPVAARTPEHNLWAQATVNHNINKLGLSHRYRLEQRWVGNVVATPDGHNVEGSTHKNRLRYRITAKFNLPNQDKFYVALFDEIFVNYGKNVGTNFFDQNWIYGGIGCKLNEQSNLELAYQWQVIEKSGGVYEESNNTFQLSYHYNLDWR